MGLITREERKVYLWGEWRREREGGREGRREREREREKRQTGHAWHTMQGCREYVGKSGELSYAPTLCQDTTDNSSTLNPSLIHYPITKTFIVSKLVKFQLPIAYLIDYIY